MSGQVETLRVSFISVEWQLGNTPPPLTLTLTLTLTRIGCTSQARLVL